MFRKTWKTIKVFLVIGVILICLPHSILPHQKDDLSEEEFEEYRQLNKIEKRLQDFKDNDEALRLKLIQLQVINGSRKKFKADPVKLDILASRVANRMCRNAAENNYIGHWNIGGEKPYHRYAVAGGYDHITENAFGEWSSDNYEVSASNISSKMKSGHLTFMDEKAPYDGHKKTIIEKSHNFVGIGYFLSGKQFRYYEEFIDRYLSFEDIPGDVKTGEACSITVKTDGKKFLYYLIIYREQYPRPMTPSQISGKGSYEDYSDEEYLKLFAWDLARYKSGSAYKIPLSFAKEGLYYIQIYSDKNEIVKPTSLTTKGKTAESGIVIRVHD